MPRSWIVDDLDMSDKTCAYLEMARQRYKELEPLSDADLLTLDYFWQGMIDCYLTFTTEQLRTIAGTIGLKQKIPETDKNVSNWCSQLTLARYSFFECDCMFYLCFSTGAGHNLEKAEGVPAPGYETVCGSEIKFRHNWANRKLLGIKRKMRGREDDDIGPAVGDDNSSSSSSDEDNDCGGNKKTGIVYRSDWIVYAKTTHSITASGALEFNVSFKPN
ncbi:hypothetical protein G6F46_008673 [Rhizopus delemar]|nr:hypothetical protein G6F55_008467 [Rhizopus delemar]KAG1538987.1 hypothetical protein G6F51_009421 [Rhizopus arrhizus]KAG1491821.1 hypothetical protein G6F54_009741 [Rhizopus delemar]KAG1507276.1 hypothetical protein G6F53_009074 [Rhizopus delemar]KAG1521059.1 hypothetical protein G6F52_007084 [Rhizopus delemar]